jgi:hypothetical protein
MTEIVKRLLDMQKDLNIQHHAVLGLDTRAVADDELVARDWAADLARRREEATPAVERKERVKADKKLRDFRSKIWVRALRGHGAVLHSYTNEGGTGVRTCTTRTSPCRARRMPMWPSSARRTCRGSAQSRWTT